MLKTVIFSLILITFSPIAQAQSTPPKSPKDTSSLHHQLQTHDSLLFTIGFNQCNLTVFDTLVADNFEFYHDQSGITPNKEAFITGIKNWLCNIEYKAIRKLQPGSLEVYPMYRNGELYGAVQSGFHSFYVLYPNNPKLTLTSEARFTHLSAVGGQAMETGTGD